MVVAGIIDYSPGDATSALPAEHAAALTRTAGPDNIAAIAAYFPVLASPGMYYERSRTRWTHRGRS